MKKIFFAALLVLAILLCGCDGQAPAEASSEAPSQTEKVTDIKEAYLAIERRISLDYKKLYFGFEDSESVLAISVPSDWNIKSSAGGYEFERAGESVASLCSGEAKDLGQWTEITARDTSTNRVDKQRIVEMREVGGKPEFRHRTRYEYEDGNRVVTLVCDYAELDDEAERKVSIGASVETEAQPAGINTLSELADGRIIILGNSFINSSAIGTTLSDIVRVNGKSLDVTAISRGYAEVDTYIADENIMNSIRNREYDGVFICGFYADEEAEHLAVLEEACNSSDTELVIFPAHNEFESCIKKAQQRCPDLKTLDWRGEINMLIDSGINMWEFCQNDAHKHSTPLAGFVGAQMIYRAIYGEIPTEAFGNKYVSLQGAEDILGEYAELGILPVDYDVLYLD